MNSTLNRILSNRPSHSPKLLPTFFNVHRVKQPTLFLKHLNKVEQNKDAFDRSSIKPSSSSEVKKLESPLSLRHNFTARREREIVERHQKMSAGRKSLGKQNGGSQKSRVKKQKVRGEQKRMQIARLEKKFQFSCFDLHSMQACYQSLLIFSKGKVSKFKKGFEAVLNFGGVGVDDEKLNSLFRGLKSIDFDAYLFMFKQIEAQIVQKKLGEYLETIFQHVYDFDKIKHSDILSALRSRVMEGDAQKICQTIYSKFNKASTEPISLKALISLCQTSEEFRRIISQIRQSEAAC